MSTETTVLAIENVEPSAPHLEDAEETAVNISDATTSNSDDESASLYTDDVIAFHVRGKIFSIHRKLLQAKSPVFAAMFKHRNMKEAKERTVEITDIEVKVFEKLLLYIYKGKVSGLEQHAVELWMAADKYQIDSLKTICEQHMCPTLSSSTVIDGLLFADSNSITRLRTTCIDYLNNHAQSVIKNRRAKWEHFKASANVPLFADLYEGLTEVVQKQSNKITDQKILIENLRKNRPENYSPRLNWTKELARIGAWILFGVTCAAVVAFLGYVVYVGVTESVTYAVLFTLFAAFVVLRYGIDCYVSMRERCLANRRRR